MALWQTLREKNKLTCGSQEKKNRIGLLMRRRASFSWEVVRKRLRTEAAERQRLVCVIAALTYPFSNVFFPNTQLLNLIQKKKESSSFSRKIREKTMFPTAVHSTICFTMWLYTTFLGLACLSVRVSVD